MARRQAQALADPLLSVVMPAYNERDTIEEIIRRALAAPLRIELIVVDDASTDGTRDILQTLAAPVLAFRLLLQPGNQGKGAALRMPITYDGRGYDEGKKITWKDGVVAVWTLLKYRFTE